MTNLSKFLFAAIFSVSFASAAHADPRFTADNCLDGQDMRAEDIDIKNCPPIPNSPQSARLGNTGDLISLGAWELGQTADGEVYKYGSLSSFNGSEPRIL